MTRHIRVQVLFMTRCFQDLAKSQLAVTRRVQSKVSLTVRRVGAPMPRWHSQTGTTHFPVDQTWRKRSHSWTTSRVYVSTWAKRCQFRTQRLFIWSGLKGILTHFIHSVLMAAGFTVYRSTCNPKWVGHVAILEPWSEGLRLSSGMFDALLMLLTGLLLRFWERA